MIYLLVYYSSYGLVARSPRVYHINHPFKGKFMKLMHLYLFLLLIIGPGALSAENREITISKNLLEAANNYYTFVISDRFNPATCSRLHQINQRLYRLNPKYFTNLTGLSESPDRTDLISTFFQIRVKLQDKMKEFIKSNQFNSYEELENCTNHIRIATRTIRNWEEVWGTYLLHQLGKSDYIPANMGNEWPYLVLNKKYNQQFHYSRFLRSGDILLSRANSFVSAIISRIGSVDNQFSHLAFVYRADGTLMGEANKGRLYVVESVIANGLQIVPIEEYLHHKKSRLALYRFRHVDEVGKTDARSIAATAAKHMAKRALNETICYNFSMNLADRNCTFCSQAIAWGIEYACTLPGNTCDQFDMSHPTLFNFPLIYSRFNRDQNPLIRMLEIDVNETFAPADVEADPRMELVAEWRDFSMITNNRIYDMALTKIFQWMEKGQYSFRENSALLAFSKISDSLAKELDKMPDNAPAGFTKGSIIMFFLIEHVGPGKVFADLASGSISRRELEKLAPTFGLSDQQIDDLSKNWKEGLHRIFQHVGFKTHLTRLSDAYMQKVGLPLTDYQMHLAMEYIRQKDCKSYQNGGYTRFHDFFRVASNNPLEACSLEPFQWFNLW